MLKNKKIVFLGDSITEGSLASDYSKSFVSVFQKETGLEVYGLGIGGTRFAYQKRPSIGDLKFDRFFESRLYEIPSDADVIVVFGGTNDYGHGDASFGLDDDETIYTFCGALNSIMTKLKIIFPNAQLIFATPLRRMEEDKESLNAYGFSHQGTLLDYRNAIIRIASKHNIPVLDLYTIYPVDPTTQENRNKYMPDGLHPNDLGHKMLAEIFVKYLSNFIK